MLDTLCELALDEQAEVGECLVHNGLGFPVSNGGVVFARGLESGEGNGKSH